MSKLGDVGHRLYTGEVSYDFVGRKRLWYTTSLVIVVVAVGALLLRGLNFGIEFRGGAEFRATGVTCDAQEAREAVEPLTTVEPISQSLGGDGIRVQTEELAQGEAGPIAQAVADACGVALQDISQRVTGATWGGEVTRQAVIALVVFLVLVSLLIRVLFEAKMAVAALVALAHDLVITIGVYALVGFEVTPATIIGMLTILGYSLYDTIVVFDSLRENVKDLDKSTTRTYSEAANLSVNQTLVRSINTSLIALLPIGAILFVGAFLLGAGTLKDLSLVLFVGIGANTFSSICIATPLLADLKEREPAMKAHAKRVQSARRKVTSGGPAMDATGPVRRGPLAGTATAVLDRPLTDGDALGEDDPRTADDDLDAPTAPTAAPRSARPARPARPTGRKGRRKRRR